MMLHQHTDSFASTDELPFFSVGYADKERVEVKLLGHPADPALEGYDWIKGLVQIDVGAFIR